VHIEAFTLADTEQSSLGLAEAVRDLRSEIAAAIQTGKDEQLKFALGPVELELQVALTLKGGAKAKAKWLVVSIGAESGIERERTHKVKLTLTPQWDGEPRVLIRDERDAKPPG